MERLPVVRAQSVEGSTGPDDCRMVKTLDRAGSGCGFEGSSDALIDTFERAEDFSEARSFRIAARCVGFGLRAASASSASSFDEYVLRSLVPSAVRMSTCQLLPRFRIGM
jgi:hypothetical protein